MSEPIVEPLEVVIDPTPLEIVKWIKARLSTITIGGDTKFKDVWISEEEEQVFEAADAMQGDVCAVIPSDPMYAIGSNARIDYVGAIPFKVLAVHYNARDAGDDPSEAIFELIRLAEIVRTAMTNDPYAGGLCKDINFGGRVIRGIDYDGNSTRAGGNSADKIFYGVSIPFIAGWNKLRA